MKEIEFIGYRNQPIALYVWDSVASPKGIVQIAHGMSEHVTRYGHLAKALNEQGYIVLGDDHRGHGKTAGERLGVAETTCFGDTVHDLMLITDYAKQKYGLPAILFGHSYGSFLTQSYIQHASEKIIAAILCGSAQMDHIGVKTGRFLAAAQYKLKGAAHPAALIDRLAFGGFDRKFPQDGKKSWISSDPQERKKYLEDPHCGTVMSVGFFLSFFQGLNKIYREENLSGIRKDLPILIMSGDKDPVGGATKLVKKLYDTYAECALSEVKLKFYRDGRHEIVNETNKDEVIEDIVRYVNEMIEKHAGISSSEKSE